MRGAGHRQTLVEGVGLPLVRLRDPPHVRVLAENVDRSILRGRVGHDVFDQHPLLAANAFDRVSQMADGVVARRNDRDFGRRVAGLLA